MVSGSATKVDALFHIPSYSSPDNAASFQEIESGAGTDNWPSLSMASSSVESSFSLLILLFLSAGASSGTS